jgi:hypothetical protein
VTPIDVDRHFDMMRRFIRLTVGVLFCAVSVRLSAQSASESAEHPPVFAMGIAAGAMRFASGRTEQATTLVLQLQPVPWLSFSAAPGYGRTTFGRAMSAGLTEMPLSAGAMYSGSDLPWSPSVAASLSTTVAPDSAMAMGASQNAYDAEASLSASPVDPLNLGVAWSHPLTTQSGNASLRLESSLSSGRATATFGMTSELGRPDSGAVLARSVAGGAALSLFGPPTLTVDASHGITGSAPAWTFSVGLGSAFAGVSPLNATSALKRLKKSLGSNVSGTSGYGKSSGGSQSCKHTGTC